MLRIALFAVLFGLAAGPVAAQSRFYTGGSLAADSGGRGPVDVGTIPAAGVLLGWRFTDHWSAEFHVDRGFGEGEPRIFEGVLFAQAGPAREDLERTGVFGRSVWQDRPGIGWAALAVYTARQPGRVDVSVYAGVSERQFESTHTTTITGVGPDATYPPGHPSLQDRQESRTRRAGGITGGLMVPIRLAGGISVAPEVRVTLGLIGDDSYKQFYTGARFMWGF
jgi:hypothetical protein